jgi:hypothetical protein
MDRVALRSVGKGFEAKVVLATLEHRFSYGRLPVVKALLALPVRTKDLLWRRIKARRPATSVTAFSPTGPTAKIEIMI